MAADTADSKANLNLFKQRMGMGMGMGKMEIFDERHRL
jgi:hypothetical protein